MLPFMSIKQFLRDMRSQKLRTFMTMFGILWGTAAIILLMSFGKGIQVKQETRAKGMGENISVVWPGLTSKPWEGLPRGRHIRFTEEDVVRMKASYPSIHKISPEFSRWNVPVKSKKDNMLCHISGVWPEFGEMRNIIPQLGGRFINAFDIAEKRRVVFIGNQLADKLFPGEDPIGQMLLLNRVPFIVIGVLKEKVQSGSYGGRDSRNCFVPSSTMLTMYSFRYPNNIIVQSKTVFDMPKTKKSIYQYMAGKYNFDPDDTEALSIWDTTEGLRFWKTLFTAFQAFLIFIGILTLITGGIGVTNIMNVVLEERTKEIGIKMALGAKKLTIMGQFIFETLLLTLLGGTLGFLVAFGIIKVFPYLGMNDELGVPVIRPFITLISVGVLGIVALLSGFFPARKAAALEPVKALKLF